MDPSSVIEPPVALDLPVFPFFSDSPEDPFLLKIQARGKKWVVITDTEGGPRLVLDSDAFLRDAFFSDALPDPYRFYHRPLVVENPTTTLGKLIRELRVEPCKDDDDDVIDHDLFLLWGDERRIVTGADLLGRLMRGIVRRVPASSAERATLAPLTGPSQT